MTNNFCCKERKSIMYFMQSRRSKFQFRNRCPSTPSVDQPDLFGTMWLTSRKGHRETTRRPTIAAMARWFFGLVAYFRSRVEVNAVVYEPYYWLIPTKLFALESVDRRVGFFRPHADAAIYPDRRWGSWLYVDSAGRDQKQTLSLAASSGSLDSKKLNAATDSPNPTLTFGGEVLSEHLSENTRWKGSRWQLAQCLNWPESKLSRVLNGAVACRFNDFVAIVEVAAKDSGNVEKLVSDLLAEAYSREIKALAVERPSVGRYLFGSFRNQIAEGISENEADLDESEVQETGKKQ